MFDSVGRNLDDEAAARSAKSALIASSMAAFVAGLVVCGGAWTVKEVVLDDMLDDDMFEIAMDEILEDELEAPPPPPPPPPSAATPDEEEDEEEEDEPDPDDVPDEVMELDEEIKEEMKSADKPKGVEGGVDGGQEGGVVGGVIGGVEGGVLGGKLSGGPKVFHHSQLEVKKRVQPQYPSAAKGLGLGEQRCVTTVHIDEKGTPYKVTVDGCPKVFHGPTEEAIMKWRWYPTKDMGSKIRVQTKIIVKYKEVG